MAITKASSSIFTLDRGEVDDFARKVRSALQLGSEGGALSVRPQARFESLHMTSGVSIHLSLRGATTTKPTQIVIEVRVEGSREKYLIALNTYKKQLHPHALYCDSRGNEVEQDEWDGLTADEVVARLK